ADARRLWLARRCRHAEGCPRSRLRPRPAAQPVCRGIADALGGVDGPDGGLIMAGGWSVILESSESGAQVAAGAGKSLLYYQRHIDDLATRLGLTRLSDFFSRSRADILAY